ncbi:Hypothetical predicted protein [Marmota monax]|uniref:Uncharacterized protein n=1 Tax=Marmota monax TaxID=9995 RepID=A0A5E4B297_MARMO|nr:Hypothetical predicted protein [Marmota monax]
MHPLRPHSRGPSLKPVLAMPASRYPKESTPNSIFSEHKVLQVSWVSCNIAASPLPATVGMRPTCLSLRAHARAPGGFPATPMLTLGHESSSRAGGSARLFGGEAGWGAVVQGRWCAACACAEAGGSASRAGRWRRRRRRRLECEHGPGAAGPGAVRPRPCPSASPSWATRPAWRVALATGLCRLEALALARAPVQGSLLQHQLAADSSPRRALRGPPQDCRFQAKAPAGECESWRPRGGELEPEAGAGAWDPKI